MKYKSDTEQVKRLKLEIAELKQALTGRTLSCSFCNQAAKERDHLVKQVEEWQHNCRELMYELNRARER